MPPRLREAPQMPPEQTPIAGKVRTTTQNNDDAKFYFERRKLAHAAAR